MKASHLNINNLTVRYGRTLAVDSLSLEVNSETVVLFGASGCGKTTVLKAILGILEPGMHVDGEILLNGVPLARGSGKVGMVFQGPVVPSWMTVSALCRMGSRVRKLSKSEQDVQVDDMLNRFDMNHLADRYPYQLSGGQKQRVALAVTLLNEPSVLLLDEPSTFIDGMTRLAIWEFLEKEVRPLGIPTVIVSHDPTEAIRLADRIYSLSSPATVLESLEVPFLHPRDDSMARDDKFWDIRKKLVAEVP